MAREQAPILDAGDVFPSLQLMTTDGNQLTLPSNFNGKWTVLLFYRGNW